MENDNNGVDVQVEHKPQTIKKSKGSFVLELLFLLTTIFMFFGIADKWFWRVALPMGVNLTTQANSDGSQSRIGNFNILVLGVDSVEGTHRSDTIFVLGVNPAKSRISMLSIPRDTRVLINSKARKINEILPRYGVPVLRSLIEDLMQIQLSRYVKVDFQGFINIIDIMGGLEIDIEKPMHYDDNWGKLHIHFNKGLNKLDGKDALNYVRFRADASADLGRIKRQQKFIRVLLEKASSPAVVVKLPKIISEAFGHIETDFSFQEVIAIAGSFSKSKVQFRNSSLPGEARYIDKISYFLPYRDKAIELGNSQFSDLAAVELVASFSSNLASGTANEN
jgi:LCP family protein required for cell wall assembly